MNKQGARIYFMLMGGFSTLINHECLPYSRQLPQECDIGLTSDLVRLDASVADTNLCEDMT